MHQGLPLREAIGDQKIVMVVASASVGVAATRRSKGMISVP